MTTENKAEMAHCWTGQSILETLVLIDKTLIGGVTFVDKNQLLKGFVSDGDIRRALIHGAALTDPIEDVWNKNPIAITRRTPLSERYRLVHERNVRHLIILDEDQRYVRLQTRQEVEALHDINPSRCPVLLMAGGRGQRLMPFTTDCPKPMLEVGGTPLLQRTLEGLIEQGFEQFFISVNYLKDQIEDYFGEGERFGVQISYLEEDSPRGTGGCLHLLPDLESRNLLVLNGDLITDLDFRGLVSFHGSQSFDATMVVHEQVSKISYGVVRVDGSRFVRLDEKPSQTYFINTGIYMLGPLALASKPEEEFFDLPTLFTRLAAKNKNVGVFQHSGQWIDIGTPDQLEAARNLKIFSVK